MVANADEVIPTINLWGLNRTYPNWKRGMYDEGVLVEA